MTFFGNTSVKSHASLQERKQTQHFSDSFCSMSSREALGSRDVLYILKDRPFPSLCRACRTMSVTMSSWWQTLYFGLLPNIISTVPVISWAQDQQGFWKKVSFSGILAKLSQTLSIFSFLLLANLFSHNPRDEGKEDHLFKWHCSPSEIWLKPREVSLGLDNEVQKGGLAP